MSILSDLPQRELISLCSSICSTLQWILDQTKPEETLVLMPLAYADGEMNVRLCVAMDVSYGFVPTLVLQISNVIYNIP